MRWIVERGRRNHVEGSLVHGLWNGTCTAAVPDVLRRQPTRQQWPGCSLTGLSVSPVANPVALLDNSSFGPGPGPVQPPIHSTVIASASLPSSFFVTELVAAPPQTNQTTLLSSLHLLPANERKQASVVAPPESPPAAISPRHSCTSASDSQRKAASSPPNPPTLPTLPFPHSPWLLADPPARAAWATASPSSSWCSWVSTIARIGPSGTQPC